MNDQFYMVLPSNSSMNIYPENRTSSYKVQLPYPLELDVEKWEVALSEVQFPNNFYTIRKGYNKIKKGYVNPKSNELEKLYKNMKTEEDKEELKGIINRELEQGYTFQEHIEVIPGVYDKIEDILSQLTRHEKNNPRTVSYVYHPITQKVYIALKKDTFLDFNMSDVALCFDFKTMVKLEGSNTYASQNTASLNHYPNCNIYKDVVQNQLVGDVKAPLLRVVPLQDGRFTCVSYERPAFLPICRKNISVVEVNIRDQTGELLSFESGTSTVTLLFKRRPLKFFSK